MTGEDKPRAEPSDDELTTYVTTYLSEFRNTLETFFPDIAPHHLFYIANPVKVDIIRMGGGVLIYYQVGDAQSVTIQQFEDIKPPIKEMNFFDIAERFPSVWSEFSFQDRTYTEDDAKSRARYLALDTALQIFWLLTDPHIFEEICRKILAAELGTSFTPTEKSGDDGVDAESSLTLDEPAGFRRQEKWGFQYKHYKESRVTLDDINQIAGLLDSKESSFDIICLVTSGDLTSIGRSVAIANQRLRIWDRTILNELFHKHYDVLEEHFKNYRIAVEAIQGYFEQTGISRYNEFKKKLDALPAGQADFAKYQDLCKEILEYLFGDQLKLIGEQTAVSDGTQIRDLIFRNLHKSGFFERVFHRLEADMLIFDPKNHKDPIEKREFMDISQYPNKATGRLAILISRKGESEAAQESQTRIYTHENKVILSISDADLLEMIERKERGEEPADLLDDLLDKLSMAY
jgi:hypothetical protein